MGPIAPAVAAAAAGTTTSGKAQVLWTADVGYPLPTSGDVSGLLVTMKGMILLGVTRTTGSVTWQHQLTSNGGPCRGTVAGSAAFVACPEGESTHTGATVVAIDVASGRVLWARSTTAWSAAHVTASDSVVVLTGDLTYVTGNEAGYAPRGIYALSAGSGSMLWHLGHTQLYGWAPVVTGGVVLLPGHFTVPTTDFGYRAVDATTGTTEWSTTGCFVDPQSPPMILRQTLYMSCYQEDGGMVIAAVNTGDGSTEWVTPVPFGVVEGMTTTVLIIESGTTTKGIDRSTGTLLWTVTGRYTGTATSLVFVTQQPKPVNGLTPTDGAAIDPRTGATLGTFPFSGGWTPTGTYSLQGGAEAIVDTGTGPIMAVRLPTGGWAPPTVALAATPDGGGYWLAGQDGGVFAYGDAPFLGSLPALDIRVHDIVAMAATPDGQGYWLVGQDGGVFAFGDARFYGSAASLKLQGPVVGMAATPDGRGYWLVGNDGGVFAFGDARFYGSARTARTTSSVAPGRVSSIWPTPAGGGYWLAVSGSPPVPFGDASAFPNGPAVVGPQAAATPAGTGYWSVGQDGGVFSAGTAQFYGSLPGLGLGIHDAIDITPTPDGGGYWLLGTDGGVFAFGDAQFYGSRG